MQFTVYYIASVRVWASILVTESMSMSSSFTKWNKNTTIDIQVYFTVLKKSRGSGDLEVTALTGQFYLLNYCQTAWCFFWELLTVLLRLELPATKIKSQVPDGMVWSTRAGKVGDGIEVVTPLILSLIHRYQPIMLISDESQLSQPWQLLEFILKLRKAWFSRPQLIHTDSTDEGTTDICKKKIRLRNQRPPTHFLSIENFVPYEKERILVIPTVNIYDWIPKRSPQGKKVKTWRQMFIQSSSVYS
jgi:hypothetical protein